MLTGLSLLLPVKNLSSNGIVAAFHQYIDFCKHSVGGSPAIVWQQGKTEWNHRQSDGNMDGVSLIENFWSYFESSIFEPTGILNK